MKIKAKGNETRYDSPDAKIEAARKSSRSLGVFLKYTRWCGKCGKDKPAEGSIQIAQGIFKCFDCRNVGTK